MFLPHHLFYAYSCMLLIYIFIDSYKLYTFLLPSKIVKGAPKLEGERQKAFRRESGPQGPAEGPNS